MDLQASKKDLLRLTARAAVIADRGSTMTMLASALLTATVDQLTVAATDLYVSIRGNVAAEVKKTGSIAVPAKDLHERMKMMPDGPVRIAAKDHAIILSAPSCSRRYTLHSFPGDEFPAIPIVDTGKKIAMKRAALSLLISRVAFSICTDETRAAMNCALVEWEGERIRMVSTDGHRMSVAGQRYGEMSSLMLVPLKAIGELKRLFSEASEEDVALSVETPNALFQIDGIEFTVRLVDAVFPPYAQVIPKGNVTTLRAPRAALAGALQAVAIASSDKTGAVKMSGAGGKLKLESESADSGSGFDEIAVEHEGPEFVVGMNAKYVLDVLGAMSAETVEIKFGDDLTPVVFTAAEDDEYLAVVMPLRV